MAGEKALIGERRAGRSAMPRALYDGSVSDGMPPGVLDETRDEDYVLRCMV